MAKTAVSHICTACNANSARWFGRCPKCQEYGTVVQVEAPAPMVGLKTKVATAAPTRPARPVSDLRATMNVRRPTGLGEFDRVLGGGLVEGQVVLLAGEPGVGKSTLLLEVAHEVARERAARSGLRVAGPAGDGPKVSGTVLYISGEESAEQIAVRAQRIGADATSLLIADETDLGQVLGHIAAVSPDLIIIDSVQTIAAPEVEGRPGGVAQIHEVTQVLTRIAKTSRIPLLLIGQSTKDNAVAGPRALEHLVDTVLTFEGDASSPLRMLRATKNRFGPVNEVVCFEQVDDGLKEVPDPSAMFRMQRDAPVPGTCVTVTMEGRRAMLAEIQALLGTPVQQPRRTVAGLDFARASMLIAVTEAHSAMSFGKFDVYLATVAGARIADPAADVATCLALASAAQKVAMPADVIAIGEVALSGDIRPVPFIEQRIKEAVRLGYRRILVPPGVEKRREGGATIVPVPEVSQAVKALRRFVAVG